MSIIPKGSQLFRICCGDSKYRFRYAEGHTRAWTELKHAFREEINTLDFLPGLALEDESGQQWRPVLRVVLVAKEEEDANRDTKQLFHAQERQHEMPKLRGDDRSGLPRDRRVRHQNRGKS